MLEHHCDKQVEHDELTDKLKRNEVCDGNHCAATVVFVLIAVGRLHHTIVHDAIPTFTRRHTEYVNKLVPNWQSWRDH